MSACKPTLLNALSPVPRRHKWSVDAFGAVLAAILLACIFCGCQSPSKPRAESVPAWTNAAPYQGARGPSW